MFSIENFEIRITPTFSQKIGSISPCFQKQRMGLFWKKGVTNRNVSSCFELFYPSKISFKKWTAFPLFLSRTLGFETLQKSFYKWTFFSCSLRKKSRVKSLQIWQNFLPPILNRQIKRISTWQFLKKLPWFGKHRWSNGHKLKKKTGSISPCFYPTCLESNHSQTCDLSCFLPKSSQSHSQPFEKTGSISPCFLPKMFRVELLPKMWSLFPKRLLFSTKYVPDRVEALQKFII